MPWQKYVADGLIPAHAGKTIIRFRQRSGRTAHPRSRGENFRASSACTSDPGSSPLTRGKRNTPRHARYFRGLIPAHAGKTYLPHGNGDSLWAHPRSRGENKLQALEHVAPLGSSPLTRGKRGELAPVVLRRGLIPAHAGKTREVAFLTGATTAHPRSRGENDVGVVVARVLAGSSPLTRGKRPMI